MSSIFQNFPLSNDEYTLLEAKFGDLCSFAAWQLIRKNVKNNHTDEMEDIAQQLRMAVIRAGCYYKRQVYIEQCLELVTKYCKDIFMETIVSELCNLWKNRTKHGANKQKFGEHQENILKYLVLKFVPIDKRPNPKNCLRIDNKFTTYCKSITWNAQKSLGRKITRERSIRTGIVSLSEFSHLS
jgi:hypothetical protein